MSFTYKKMGEDLNTQHLHKIDGPEPRTSLILDASAIVGVEINCLGKYVHWVGSKTLKRVVYHLVSRISESSMVLVLAPL